MSQRQGTRERGTKPKTRQAPKADEVEKKKGKSKENRRGYDPRGWKLRNKDKPGCPLSKKRHHHHKKSYRDSFGAGGREVKKSGCHKAEPCNAIWTKQGHRDRGW